MDKTPRKTATPPPAKLAGKGPKRQSSTKLSRKTGTHLSIEAIDQNAIAPEDRWLSTKQAADAIGFDEDWLEGVRGGLKGVEGPPYKKIGNSRTSPIRYNLARLRQWMERFPEVVDSMGNKSSLPSITAFFSSADRGAQWLFALPESGPPVDFFEALNEGTLEKDNLPTAWLDIAEWARKKSLATFVPPKK